MTRAYYLIVSEVELLRTWGREVRTMFDAMPYHVGSSLYKSDYRDVDVRLILDDDAVLDLGTRLNLPRLNLAVSLWGQKVTGLPIDFQIQPRTEANEYTPQTGHYRNPIGMSH